jgi:hypothetical protein
MKAFAKVPQSPSQSEHTEKEILKTLEVTARFAWRLLHKGKYRRAANMAADAMRLVPRNLRRRLVAIELRMIASSAKHVADWVYGAKREQITKRKRRSRRRPAGELVTMARSTSHLLLVPEYPMVPKSPAEMVEKQ